MTIARHEFNTVWWGKPVGISTDRALLTMPDDELDKMVLDYDWIEVRCPLNEIPAAWLGPNNGFQYVDAQLSYRAPLRHLAPLSPATSLIPATDRPLGGLDDLAPFSSERYAKLPGVTAERLAARYRRWANDLVAAHPDWCAAVLHEGQPAGYIFGAPDGRSANFVLAASSVEATTPGLVIYLAAAHFFAGKGAARMASAFSSTNVGALNAHVALRCRFDKATGIWIRMTR